MKFTVWVVVTAIYATVMVKFCGWTYEHAWISGQILAWATLNTPPFWEGWAKRG